MVDREKLIEGLECCTQHGSMCGRDCNGHWGWTDGSHTGMELLSEYRTKCPYGNCETGCVKTLAKDALALLKAQEPVKPYEGRDGWYRCGNCGNPLASGERVRNDSFWAQPWPKYCEECGREVKWE